MLIRGVEFAPGELRPWRLRAWRQEGFLASAAERRQVYRDAEVLCYYPAHQHTQQGSDHRFGRWTERC